MVFEQLSQIFLQYLNIHTSWVVPLGCMLFVMTEYRPITQVRRYNPSSLGTID
jgi:hypothetical protein